MGNLGHGKVYLSSVQSTTVSTRSCKSVNVHINSYSYLYSLFKSHLTYDMLLVICKLFSPRASRSMSLKVVVVVVVVLVVLVVIH